jgi:hypothetical protein
MDEGPKGANHQLGGYQRSELVGDIHAELSNPVRLSKHVQSMNTLCGDHCKADRKCTQARPEATSPSRADCTAAVLVEKVLIRRNMLPQGR